MLKTLSKLSQTAVARTRALIGSASTPATPAVVIPRAEHSVSRKAISRNALKVLNRLNDEGHAAYLVGGGVRDVLVGLKPKDFDVATNASPEQIKALFRNSRIIGRRFRLVHVVFGRDIIEVATFRAGHDRGEGGETGASGRIVRDNVFGTIEEDARRRDFSVNALYYNIADFSVVDFVGGLEDIEARVFRLIGDPVSRCQEDPVRVLRAARLAAKLDFDIHPDTLSAMRACAHGLNDTPPARLFEEVLKLFQGGYARQSFDAVVEQQLLVYLFPLLAARLKTGDPDLSTMIANALDNTDRRVAQGKPITPAYLLAFMLWPDVEERALAEVAKGESAADALMTAADSVMAQQLRVVSIPRRFSGQMREIWSLQPRLEDNRGGRALSLIENKRFRAAYDFLLLRSTINPALQPLARWWTDIQKVPEDERSDAVEGKPDSPGQWGRGGPSRKKKRSGSGRRRGRGRGRSSDGSGGGSRSGEDTSSS